MTRAPRLPAAARWSIVVVAAAILAWAANHALRAAWTSDTRREALLSFRVPIGSLPPDLAWPVMWERLKAANAVEPGNPGTEEMQGLLAARRIDERAKLFEAATHYTRSLALRPIAANTWANLAQARFLVGDTGAIFQAAIENAARLGPSHAQVQRTVAMYGLMAFDEVGPPTRAAIDSMVAAGMRRDPAEMLAIAKSRERLEVACRHLGETKRKIDPSWEKTCAEALRKP